VRRTLVLLAALCFATPALAAPPSGAPDKQAQDEGRERFKRGVELYRDGDFRAALIEFNRAYDVAPSYKIQFNIGQTCAELQDYACALRAFDRYVRDGGKDVPKDRQKQVEKDLDRLKKLVATIRVTVNKPGADVALDDVAVGRSPLPDPLLVGAGRHRITVTLAPSPVVTRIVDVAGGDQSDVAIDLSEPAPPPVVEAPKPVPIVAPPPPAEPPPSRAPFWVSLATTGVLGAGVIVMGSLSLGAKSDLDRTAGRLGATTRDIDSAQSKLQAMTITTDVLLVSTVVAAGLTTVLFFTTSAPKKPAVQVGAGLGSLTLSGAF
jgi:hypothetical protein